MSTEIEHKAVWFSAKGGNKLVILEPSPHLCIVHSSISGNARKKRKSNTSVVGNAMLWFTIGPTSTLPTVLRPLCRELIKSAKNLNEADRYHRNTNINVDKRRTYAKAALTTAVGVPANGGCTWKKMLQRFPRYASPFEMYWSGCLKVNARLKFAIVNTELCKIEHIGCSIPGLRRKEGSIILLLLMGTRSLWKTEYLCRVFISALSGESWLILNSFFIVDGHWLWLYLFCLQ